MRNNGIVTEKAHLNIDSDKFEESHTKIFGERKKIICNNPICELSSKQKWGLPFVCPHCKLTNGFVSKYNNYRIVEPE